MYIFSSEFGARGMLIIMLVGRMEYSMHILLFIEFHWGMGEPTGPFCGAHDHSVVSRGRFDDHREERPRLVSGGSRPSDHQGPDTVEAPSRSYGPRSGWVRADPCQLEEVERAEMALVVLSHPVLNRVVHAGWRSSPSAEHWASPPVPPASPFPVCNPSSSGSLFASCLRADD